MSDNGKNSSNASIESQLSGLFCRTYKLSDFPDRFRSKVRIDGKTGCWIWQACVHYTRYKDRVYVYPYYAVAGTPESQRPAHRFAYEFVHGPMPEGLESDHLCRNTLCVNPSHIEAVTHQVNCARRLKSGPAKGCKMTRRLP